MSRFLPSLLLTLSLLVAAAGQAGPLPGLEAAAAPFAVTPYEGATAALKMDSEFAAAFRTSLAEGLKQPVNFGGDQVLVTWGCGSNCVDGGVVSARNGRAVPLPFTLHRSPAESRPDLLYHRGSRLLVAQGFFDEAQEEPSGRCYVWQNEQWRELDQLDCAPYLPASFDPTRLTREATACRSNAAGDRQALDRCLLELSCRDILAFKREVELVGGNWEMRMAPDQAELVTHFLHTSALIYRLPAPASRAELRRRMNQRLHQVLKLVSDREELRRNP